MPDAFHMKKIRKILRRIIADLRASCWALVVFGILYLVIHRMFGAFCPMLVLTGIPCPGCGLTRAFLFLARGEMGRAVSINPSILPMLFFLLYCGYFRYIRGERIRYLGGALSVLVIAMLVIYGYRMYLYFPNRAPYVYREQNIAAEWIPGYGERIRRLFRF